MGDEYIDKVKVGAKIQMMYIRREMDYGGENDFCGGMRKALRVIENMPAADVQPKATCRMIPLEPDCRGYTDVFICTHCHQHIHLGFIRKEYSGNFCIECGAELKEAE